MTFWGHVRKYANEKVKEQYIKKHRHDRKCPRCNTWISEVGGYKSLSDWGIKQLMTCEKCEYISVWDMTTFLPSLSEKEYKKAKGENVD